MKLSSSLGCFSEKPLRVYQDPLPGRRFILRPRDRICDCELLLLLVLGFRTGQLFRVQVAM
jgi:hypothetical protein